MTIEMIAGAKLTLSLRVVGVRSDGYHDLDALVVTIDEPHDRLDVTLGRSGVRLRVQGPAAHGVPVDDGNLVTRALHALAEHVPGDRGADIVLDKSIPAGAGLGGGSADAAALLRTMGKRWKVPYDTVMRVAAGIGSDVPVCTVGGAAWMRGRGERVTPVRIPTLRVLVVAPPFPLSTVDVYRAYDELPRPASPRVVTPPPELASALPPLVNDLEPAAEHVEPKLRDLRREIETASGLAPLLAGSGSAYALVCGDESEWRDTRARLERALGLSVHAALSLQPYPPW